MVYNPRFMQQTMVSRDTIGISIIIPAYNEQQSIRSVVDEIHDLIHKQDMDCEIIVVDDGSTDRTAEVLRDKAVQVIRHPENRGYGASIKTGVFASRFPWILITDADGTYPIASIPKLLENMDHYDMVV